MLVKKWHSKSQCLHSCQTCTNAQLELAEVGLWDDSNLSKSGCHHQPSAISERAQACSCGLKLGTLTAIHNATPRLPSAIQEPPVLPVRDHGAKVSRSKGSRMVLDEPGIVKRKATKVCACEVSKLTSICLHVSIPRVMQAFHERLQMLPSEPKKVIIRHKGVALSAPPKFQCPSTRKPRQPLGITPPPVLEKPARNPSSALPFGVPVSPASPAPVTTSTNPVDPVEIQAVGSQSPGAPEDSPDSPLVDQATTAAEKTFSALSHVSPCLEGGRFFW